MKSRAKGPDAHVAPSAAGSVANSATRQRSVHEIYSLPLPIRTFPLPAFHPENPISIFHLFSAWLGQLLWPPAAQPEIIYEAFWSEATNSVNISDELSMRALWEQGFYGKGSLSRSEPNWLRREQVRRGMEQAHVSEITTLQRRQERAQAKWERARLEQEAIRQTRQREAGGGDWQPPTASASQWTSLACEGVFRAPVGPLEILQLPNSGAELKGAMEGSCADAGKDSVSEAESGRVDASLAEPGAADWKQSNAANPECLGQLGSMDREADPQPCVNQEHLQLMPEEAFFLAFGLGLLRVRDPRRPSSPLSTGEMLDLFRRHSYFPPRVEGPGSDAEAGLGPDDEFLVQYAVYHHFRSLGWVPRAGIKFGVDWLLYARGPVFDHAEFGLVVIPSYSDPSWGERGKRRQQKTWAWLHGVVRVLSHVTKSLVLVYVDVPAPGRFEEALAAGIGEMLGLYRVREVMVRRWSSNRNR